MASDGKSLGVAIDEIVNALNALDPGSRVTAVKAACDHLNLQFKSGPAKLPDNFDGIAARAEDEFPGHAAITNIRSLTEQKEPASAIEMACVAAYYLQHHSGSDNRSDITAADVEKYFVQAGFPLPKRSDQLLVNAKAAGYFDSTTRGAYKLNAVGHNLVAHTLPRKASSSSPSSRRSKLTHKRKRRPHKRHK